MNKLIKDGFNKDNITSFGNMFLLGNGHLGYRGTLEEFSKDELVGLNVSGFYDRYQKLWRETVNLPNPFYIKVSNNIEKCDVLEGEVKNHRISLDIVNGLFSRKTEFKSLIITSERFVSNADGNTICLRYLITAKEEQDVELYVGMDPNIWEINGPHFKKSKYKVTTNGVSFYGKTNEKKEISEVVSYKFKGFEISKLETGFLLKAHLKKEEKREIFALDKIYEYQKYLKHTLINKKIYLEYKDRHIKAFNKKFLDARVEIIGDKDAQDELDYSVYHLSILSNKNNKLSIAARGVSGQTYKGAIFWDTEIFLVPYFTLTDPLIARNCLLYRINTLKEAKLNAKSHRYDGAFYPWESQEGKEMCSKYNVTDVFTGEPIRTYFNEKQIHTSADMVISLDKYLDFTHDYELLDMGGLEMIKECIKFYMSYGYEYNDKVHFHDVIGPDEYHERVNDNMFTNYSIKKATNILLKYLPKEDELYQKVEEFEKKIYLIPINERGVYEQFKGYFKLEDVDVPTVRSRLRHEREYWGGKNGVATKTRVIKQADVIAMLALYRSDFSIDVIKSNYDFYLKYTEHGSSLSSSMYSLCGLLIGDNENAYNMFRQSSSIDLGTKQKMYAGGIYIGGTHPASNAGAYLDVVRGFCGLNVVNDKLSLKPNLPEGWQEVKFKINFRNKKYSITVNRVESKVEEIGND